MINEFSNIYNNLIKLSRNEEIYKLFTSKDTFSDRLTVFFLHFSFFLFIFKKYQDKEYLQKLHDFVFKQIELSIREIGYGDMTINKKMKEYLNLFYSILEKSDKWEKLNEKDKLKYLNKFFNSNKNIEKFAIYIDKYLIFLRNNTLNSLSKSVINTNI